MITRNLFVFLLSFTLFVIGCGDDDNEYATAPDKDAVFIYGLIGQRQADENTDSSYTWVYSRIYNNADYANITAVVETEEGLLDLVTEFEVDYASVSNQENYVNVRENAEYDLIIADSENSYSGSIKVLPYLQITSDSLIDDDLILEWNNCNADFYEVSVVADNKFYNRYIVQSTQITIDLEAIRDTTEYLTIDVYAFSGFDPDENPIGNIEGCRGFFMGYTRDDRNIHLPSATITNPPNHNSPEDMDKIIRRLQDMANERTATGVNWDFIFTYAYVRSSIHAYHEPSSFWGNILVEPANSVNSLSGTINDIQIRKSVWSYYYYDIHHIEEIYDSWDEDFLVELDLNINGVNANAALTVPDTFSVVNCPSYEQIPEGDFFIDWNDPVNREFFILRADQRSINHTYTSNIFITEDTTYTFPALEDSIEWISISIYAINGANPMNELEPNLESINGYYYTTTVCNDWISYYDHLSSTSAFSAIKTKEFQDNEDKEISDFILSKLAEKNPKILNHKNRLISSSSLD